MEESARVCGYMYTRRFLAAMTAYVVLTIVAALRVVGLLLARRRYG